ncbi:antimicrobial peptide microplusin [Rhipicephalus sanguineus]|uniref:antimicrobial peptide microplusin n=1 Tax=Rhipicephalus sanguineus TaxID=34632 RepID=UPI001893FE33|nr:antimicrobial peptide microplusin [Rhipicephalus sanguineus]
MKAVFVSAILVVTLVASTSAHHKELCLKSDDALVTELECIKQHISPATNAAFDTSVQQLNCLNRACAYRKMCATGDVEQAMSAYFTSEQINEIHDAATACDPDVHHGDGH